MPERERIYRVALLSPCGHGNLGDAAIQQAAIQAIRSRIDYCSIIGITLVPEDTESRHGIKSYPIAAFSRPHYGVTSGSPTIPANTADTVDNPRSDFRQTLTETTRNLMAGAARTVLPKGLPYRIRLEVRHWWMAYRVLKDVDLLVISGGGQIDDYWGGPFGHPYALFKWVLLARLRRREAAFLSVGFGSLSSWWSRFFARSAFRMSGYRSFRDEGSRTACERLGFRGRSHVYPDLAFGVDCRPSAQSITVAERAIGLSPMVYQDPRSWPEKDAGRFNEYIRKLIEVGNECLAAGNDVHLFASDGPDIRPVIEIYHALGDGKPTSAGSRAVLIDVNSVGEFIDAASRVRTMVVTRLHGAILSFVARTPVVALSYDRKVSTVMDEMGESENCLNIDEFSPGDATTRIELTSRRNGLGEPLLKKLDRMETQLNLQYDNIFRHSEI